MQKELFELFYKSKYNLSFHELSAVVLQSLDDVTAGPPRRMHQVVVAPRPPVGEIFLTIHGLSEEPWQRGVHLSREP